MGKSHNTHLYGLTGLADCTGDGDNVIQVSRCQNVTIEQAEDKRQSCSEFKVDVFIQTRHQKNVKTQIKTQLQRYQINRTQSRPDINAERRLESDWQTEAAEIHRGNETQVLLMRESSHGM